MQISIKKICKLSLYFTIFYILLYDNIILAQNITESFDKIKKEKKIVNLPNIVLFNLNNEKVPFNEISKNKKLIINFWATWCAPCIKEMPDLIKLSKILKKSNFEIIYINQDNSQNVEKVLEFIKNIRLEENNVYLDPNMKLSKIFKLRGIPTTFITNDSGTVIWRVEGIINWNNEKIINFIKNM